MILAVLLSLLAMQEQSPQIEETLEIKRKQLRVRVTGKDGRPATGLAAADFALDVNGRLVTRLTLREIPAGHFYLLTYDAPDGPEELQLKLLNSAHADAELHYGSLVNPPDSFQKQPEQRQVDFENTLFFGAPHEELDVRWGAYQFISESGGFRYTPYGAMPFAEFPDGGYEIGFAALDEHAALVDYTKMVLNHQFTFDVFRFYDLLNPETAATRLRIYVRDMETGKGYLNEIEAPPPPDPSKTSLSSLVLHKADEPPAFAFHKIRYHRQKKKNDVPVPADPFQIGEELLPIGTEAEYKTDDSLRLFFHIQNLQGELTDMKLNCTARSGRTRLRIPLNPLAIKEVIPGTFGFYGELDASRLDPGNYDLVVVLYSGKTRFKRSLDLVLQ